MKQLLWVESVQHKSLTGPIYDTSANSENPDEMPQKVASHLGLHSFLFPKPYMATDIICKLNPSPLSMI